jgi:hypothetical protein
MNLSTEPRTLAGWLLRADIRQAFAPELYKLLVLRWPGAPNASHCH